jgi:hypothetical protein
MNETELIAAARTARCLASLYDRTQRAYRTPIPSPATRGAEDLTAEAYRRALVNLTDTKTGAGRSRHGCAPSSATWRAMEAESGDEKSR